MSTHMTGWLFAHVLPNGDTLTISSGIYYNPWIVHLIKYWQNAHCYQTFKHSIESQCWDNKGAAYLLFFHCPSQPALNLLHRCIRKLLPKLTLTYEKYWCLIHHSIGADREKTLIKPTTCVFDYQLQRVCTGMCTPTSNTVYKPGNIVLRVKS